MIAWLLRNCPTWLAGWLGYEAGESSAHGADAQAYAREQAHETEAIGDAVKAAPADAAARRARLEGEGV